VNSAQLQRNWKAPRRYRFRIAFRSSGFAVPSIAIAAWLEPVDRLGQSSSVRDVDAEDQSLSRPGLLDDRLHDAEKVPVVVQELG
jgi:hypothetical protein